MRLLLLYPRMPYPPEKGDKIRTFHQFAFLAERHEVWCACFVDDVADWAHVAACARMCAYFEPVPLSPRWSAARGLMHLLSRCSVSEGYLNSAGMRRVVDHWSRRTEFDAVLCFGAGMGAYGLRARAGRRCLDLCDLDSLKWREYAERRRPPARWLYATESRRVAELEQAQAERFDAVTLIAEHEAAVLRARLGAARVHVVGNGVDTAEQAGCGTPAHEPVIAFVGAMDYWPNEDAVCWFAESVWPGLRHRAPEAEWVIVGRNPRKRVRRLGSCPNVVVTGRVPEVVSYLRGARVVIAPLRVARGIQNKVLEGMACGRPVVASREAAKGIAQESLPGLTVVDTRQEWISALEQLLIVDCYAEQEGLAARAWVRENFSWPERLEQMERVLLGPCILETRSAAAEDVLAGRRMTAEAAV